MNTNAKYKFNTLPNSINHVLTSYYTIPSPVPQNWSFSGGSLFYIVFRDIWLQLQRQEEQPLTFAQDASFLHIPWEWPHFDNSRCNLFSLDPILHWVPRSLCRITAITGVGLEMTTCEMPTMCILILLHFSPGCHWRSKGPALQALVSNHHDSMCDKGAR